MGHLLAQVIVTAPSENRRAVISTLLDPAHFAIASVPGTEVRKKAREGRPDMIIVDMVEDADLGIALCAEFNNHPETSPVSKVMLGNEESALPPALTAELGADDLIVDVDDAKAMMARLVPILRLSTMKTELRRRLTSASGFGLLLDPHQDLAIDDDPYSILIAAGEPESAKVVLNEGLEARCFLETVATPFAAETALEKKRFDACVIVEDETVFSQTGLWELAERIRLNPRLFNLPVIVATRGDCDHKNYYTHGVSRVLSLAADTKDFGAVVTLLVNRQRLRWRIRQAMDEALDPLILEPSGAFREDFFLSHLNRMIADAHECHKPLAVLGYDFPTIAEVRENFGEEASRHLARQLAQWINTMTRVEDLVAQVDDSLFYVALPDTPQADADFVMQRLAGILSHTDFALYDVYRPIEVSSRHGLAMLDGGDSPKDLLDRVKSNLK